MLSVRKSPIAMQMIKSPVFSPLLMPTSIFSFRMSNTELISQTPGIKNNMLDPTATSGVALSP